MIYEMERRSEFPRRFYLISKCVVRDLDELEHWLTAPERQAWPVGFTARLTPTFVVAGADQFAWQTAKETTSTPPLFQPRVFRTTIAILAGT